MRHTEQLLQLGLQQLEQPLNYLKMVFGMGLSDTYSDLDNWNNAGTSDRSLKNHYPKDQFLEWSCIMSLMLDEDEMLEADVAAADFAGVRADLDAGMLAHGN